MPRYLPTGTGLETKGRFGKYFEPASMGTVMIVFLLSMLFTYVLVFMRGQSLALVVPCVLIAPNVATLYVIFALVQGKPRGHLRDWFRWNFRGVEAVPVPLGSDARAWPRLDL
jgi:hypothetical protein